MSPNIRRYLATASRSLGAAAVLAILAGNTLVNGRTPWGLCVAASNLMIVSPLFALVAVVLGHICRNRTGWIMGYLSVLAFALMIWFGFPSCGEHFP